MAAYDELKFETNTDVCIKLSYLRSYTNHAELRDCSHAVKAHSSWPIMGHREPLVLRVSHKAWPHHQLMMSTAVSGCFPLRDRSSVCGNGGGRRGGGMFSLPSVSLSLCLCFGDVTRCHEGMRRDGQSPWSVVKSRLWLMNKKPLPSHWAEFTSSHNHLSLFPTFASIRHLRIHLSPSVHVPAYFFPLLISSFSYPSS